jgi:hypothetical protein
METHKTLKRLLVNGPLTGYPARPADQELIIELAALKLDAAATYREPELNAVLKDWLATFCAPFGIDHVTLRRELVDRRFLSRDTAGASYAVNRERIAAVTADGTVEPGAVLAEIHHEREARKRRHAA